MDNFNLSAYLADLTEICAIDSGHAHAQGTNAMADFFEKRYQELKLQTERVYLKGNDHAPMLLVRNSQEQEIDVLMIAHMDTVYPVGTAEQWPLTVDEKGLAHAPGCVDCKGGCLSIYYLIRHMLEKKKCNFRFCIALNSDEEKGGSFYSRDCLQALAQHAKYCLVFEPGRAGDQFVGCRKGSNNYRVICHGVSAHSGVDPEKGASAIVELSRWVGELHSLNDYANGTSMNIGRIEGGIGNGMVPDYAELTFSYRFLDPKAPEKLDAMLERMCQHPFDTRTRIETEVLYNRPGLFPHEKTEQMFAVLRQVGEELGQKVELVTTGGCSDGNWISCFGVATLDGCGPCGGELHTQNEYLKTWTVEQRLDIMEGLLCKLFPEIS